MFLFACQLDNPWSMESVGLYRRAYCGCVVMQLYRVYSKSSDF